MFLYQHKDTRQQTKSRLKTFLIGLRGFSGNSNGDDGNINENKTKAFFCRSPDFVERFTRSTGDETESF